jgi:hypothetical protein
VSKSTDHVLLIPGETGWELWVRQGEDAYALHSTSETGHAGELAAIPSGELVMAFPVRSITAVPMRVSSEDDALFPDLATLHAERMGLRPDPMAGQLTDVFVVAREKESTALLAVFLRPPGEGDMPQRGPKGFDISARALPVAGEALVMWREFGRWVFAVHHDGKLAYCQATAVDSPQPDAALAREIKLSLMQLSMQGLHFNPTRVVVWTHMENPDLSEIRNAFKASVESAPRPAPVLPSPLSILLPEDVRAARRTALKRRNITLAATAAGIAYLGVIGWLAYGLWQTHNETKRLGTTAAQAAPEGVAYAEHIAKWDELADAIDISNSTVDILHRIAACIPAGSGLRLRTADINPGKITIQGEAPQLQAVNTFSLNLSKSNSLLRYSWQTPEPNQSNRGWEFVYTGEVAGGGIQP